MSLSVGIVGLPNVGKSTLFNALLKKQAALAANYPFATIEPNVGIVDVPDVRLGTLAKLIKDEYQSKYTHKEVPEKVIPATVKFNDIAGLVSGAHKGEGLGNQFLGHIREVDAIIHVVRAFEDENVVRAGSTNPTEDIGIINTELILADLQSIEKKIEKAHSDIKRERSKSTIAAFDFIEKLSAILNSGELPAYSAFSIEEQGMLKSLNLLASKPVIYVFNISEDVLSKGESYLKGKYSTLLPKQGNAIFLSAKIESELAVLEDTERDDYMAMVGINTSGLDRVIAQSYELLNLQTFLTAGPKEVKAWTIEKGTKAPQAAGKIHTDFEKAFIAADVVSYQDYATYKTWKNVKEKGLGRVEGKEYMMQEGDIVEFRVNV